MMIRLTPAWAPVRYNVEFGSRMTLLRAKLWRASDGVAQWLSIVRKNAAGVVMGMPFHGLKTSKSASLLINAAALQARAKARNLASFSSRQAPAADSSLAASSSQNCARSATRVQKSMRVCSGA